MPWTRHLFDLVRWKYLWRGAAKCLSQEKTCPCCGSTKSSTIDRKWVYRLEQCRRGHIRYRFPYERAEEMRRYYQGEYKQAGLTTDLPTPEALRELVEADFAGG